MILDRTVIGDLNTASAIESRISNNQSLLLTSQQIATALIQLHTTISPDTISLTLTVRPSPQHPSFPPPIPTPLTASPPSLPDAPSHPPCALFPRSATTPRHRAAQPPLTFTVHSRTCFVLVQKSVSIRSRHYAPFAERIPNFPFPVPMPISTSLTVRPRSGSASPANKRSKSSSSRPLVSGKKK